MSETVGVAQRASRSLLMLPRDLPIYLSASALREGQSWLEAP